MIKTENIATLCKDALSDSQFIVDIKINNANDIFVYIDDFNGLTIEECKRINRYIESQLDRETEDFSMEVGSPGLAKPFKVDEQYKKSLNTQVEMVFIDGEKIIGILSDFNESEITIQTTETQKINNKKQEVTENHIFKKNNIKTTKSIISFK